MPSQRQRFPCSCRAQGTASDAFNSSRAGGGGGGAGFAPSLGGDALSPVQDVSELFGSQWGLGEERFEASGEDVNRRFSIELERLRAEAPAPPPAPGDLFFAPPPEEDLVPGERAGQGKETGAAGV